MESLRIPGCAAGQCRKDSRETESVQSCRTFVRVTREYYDQEQGMTRAKLQARKSTKHQPPEKHQTLSTNCNGAGGTLVLRAWSFHCFLGDTRANWTKRLVSR